MTSSIAVCARFGFSLLAASAVFAVAGCGKVAEDSTHDPATAGSASPPPVIENVEHVEDTWLAEPLPPDESRRDVTTPASCEGLPGTDEELALTPRTDAEAEVLALRIAGTFTADTPTYDRIRRDLASIRSRVPALQHVRGRFYSNYVSLGVRRPTFESMKAGTYTAWDCLHARYGWSDAKTYESSGWTSSSASLIGRYDMHVIDGLYEALPGVTSVSNGGTIDGPMVCADREADGTYHYVFDDASGDCESGCIDHHRYYFVSTADGQISAKGEHSNGKGPRPDWVNRYVSGGHCY